MTKWMANNYFLLQHKYVQASRYTCCYQTMPELIYIINTFSNSLEALPLEINLRNKKILAYWISYTVL